MKSIILPRHLESSRRATTKYGGLQERVVDALADGAALSRNELAELLGVPKQNVDWAVWKLMTHAKVKTVSRAGNVHRYGLATHVTRTVQRYVPDFRPLHRPPQECPVVRQALCEAINRRM